MSNTKILSLKIGKGNEIIKQLQNSWGSAPFIWNEMSKRYLNTEDHSYQWQIEKLWPIYNDKNIPKHHRSVLMMTYDFAYIKNENFKRAANDIRLFLKDFPPKDGYANHWMEISEIFDSSYNLEAIGFHLTSVTDNLFNGEWNEEKEDYDGIDWSNTFEVYDLLESIDAKED
jgi:hypothetical protein